MTHIEIVQTDSEQPFHARFVANNGEVTFHAENMVSRHNAIRAVIDHITNFAAPGYEVRVIFLPDEEGDTVLHPWITGHGFQFQIKHVDNRTTPEGGEPE